MGVLGFRVQVRGFRLQDTGSFYGFVARVLKGLALNVLELWEMSYLIRR